MQYSTHFLGHTRFIIGQNIQKHRVLNQLSLAELAARSGVGQERITHYESGKGELHFPSLFRIACALEIQMSTLMP